MKQFVAEQNYPCDRKEANIMKLGDNIRAFREEMNLTQVELAKKLQCSQQSINKWEKEEIMPREPIIKRMLELFGVTRSELFGEPEQASMPSGKKIPILGSVRADTSPSDSENIIGWEEITGSMAVKGDFFALKVTDHSMEPEFKPDDIVIVKETTEVESRAVAIVVIGSAEAALRRVKKLEQGIILYAFNNALFEPHFYSNDEIASMPIRIIGRVVECRRAW